MDFFKQGMKGPSRPAPPAPGLAANRYSPVTNWNDDPFGSDVFEPNPQYMQKKKPPPRPPPPKTNKQPDIPAKPSHFLRKPTVLSSLLGAKKKSTIPNHTPASTNILNFPSEPEKIFPKCEPKSISTGTLIDLSSPPSSPTFTTRSSSDGLSVDSFGSDATTSTNHHNAFNGGSTSQAESGFEDDFDLFMNNRKISKEDTIEDFASDPFSPPHTAVKPPIMRKPVLSKDLFELPSSNKQPSLRGPTIIRAKPARPRPPDNSALLKSSLGGAAPSTIMSLNTTTPIQKINGFMDFEDTKPFEDWDVESSPERECSPPMPSIPPPPPPALDDDVIAEPSWSAQQDDEEPHAIALFDYATEHPNDLQFKANERIKLVRQENEDWMFGELRNGTQGLFPVNYVEVKVPLPDAAFPVKAFLGMATALYDFEPDQPGDLRFSCGDTITLHSKLNEEWYFGECNGAKGQFPLNYVQVH